jgi:signal transduction histidine kinase
MTTAWTRPGTEAWDEAPPVSAPATAALGGSVAAPEREEMVALLKAEMRAPLVALKALRASIDDGDLSPELASRMRRHTKSLARRLSLLLEDLVLVYTWGHRRPSLDLQDLDLGDQLRRAADLFPDMLVHVQAPANVRVHADALRLQQLLANLIHTAQRRGDRPVWLHVTCLETHVTLRMIGAPPAGGYELEIVRQIVEAHGGRLRHHSAQGAVAVTLRRVLPPQT